MISFAKYLAMAESDDYADTLPKSSAMLVHWRVLRLVVQFGSNKKERLHIKRIICVFTCFSLLENAFYELRKFQAALDEFIGFVKDLHSRSFQVRITGRSVFQFVF